MPDHVIIKPNVYSWRGIRIAHAFYTSYNYNRDLDSHMMKNTEWGALAYLTNSKYGRCLSGSCTEVRINNSSNFVTGSSAVNAPIVGTGGLSITGGNGLGKDSENVFNYNNPTSVASSTTNNYYGVYDMAGGAWEYVMGVMLDETGNLSSGRNNDVNSNFIGTLVCPGCGSGIASKTQWTKDDGGMEWPDKRYYDTYDYTRDGLLYPKGLLGDATKELGPFYKVTYSANVRQLGSWFADDAFFVNSAAPWFERGGYLTDGTDSGIGAFYNTSGEAASFASFRVVLTP